MNLKFGVIGFLKNSKKMPVRVVGRTAKFSGKSFLDIVCNLKNFGIGRIICRSAFLRYPEPCYYKVVSVEPEMDPENKHGKVLVEHVFRGKNYGIQPLTTVHKADYRLIPKAEEEEFCHRPRRPSGEKILPRTAPFPPLLKLLITEEMKSNKQPIDKEPELKMVYSKGDYSVYRVAEENETPNVRFSKHVSWHLYEGVMEKDDVK